MNTCNQSFVLFEDDIAKDKIMRDEHTTHIDTIYGLITLINRFARGTEKNISK